MMPGNQILNNCLFLINFTNRSKQAINVGDKVFGHVKGHPPWPAVITSKLGNNKFEVSFCCTKETGILNSKAIVKYDALTKAKNIAKYQSRVNYLEAIEEIDSK